MKLIDIFTYTLYHYSLSVIKLFGFWPIFSCETVGAVRFWRFSIIFMISILFGGFIISSLNTNSRYPIKFKSDATYVVIAVFATLHLSAFLSSYISQFINFEKIQKLLITAKIIHSNFKIDDAVDFRKIKFKFLFLFTIKNILIVWGTFFISVIRLLFLTSFTQNIFFILFISFPHLGLTLIPNLYYGAILAIGFGFRLINDRVMVII